VSSQRSALRTSRGPGPRRFDSLLYESRLGLYLFLSASGSRQEIIPQYGEGFWFVIKAHPSAHIEICAGGCNAEDGPKGKQDVALFFAEALSQDRSLVRAAGSVTPQQT
jgi:hypothetical protein